MFGRQNQRRDTMIRTTAMLSCTFACVLLLFAGCRKNSAQIAEQVKSEMQQEFTKKPGLKKLVVENVRLVKKSEEDFEGVAIGSINGEYVKFDVTCKYDGTSVLWDADLSEGSLEELRLKETARETYQLLKASWPRVKSSIGEGFDAAKKSVAEGYDAAKKKAGEYYDKAKSKAAEIAADAEQKEAEDSASEKVAEPPSDL